MIHNEVNWADYESKNEKLIASLLNEIRLYINQKSGRSFSENYYFTLFYLPLSELFYKNHIRANTTKRVKDPRVKFAAPEQSDPINLAQTNCSAKVAELSFFHRHPSYEKAFSEAKEFEKITKPQNRLLQWDKQDFAFFKQLTSGLLDDSEIIDNLFVATLFNSDLQSNFDNLAYPDVILTNAHGLYHSTLASFYFANALERNVKIVINQPGFLHCFIRHFHQVQFESRICTRYLSWSHYNENTDNRKSISFGNFYRHRQRKKNTFTDATLIVLPQRSNRTVPCSMYYGECSENSDLQIQNIVLSLKNNIEKFTGKVVLRCKSMDLDFYQSILQDIDFDIELESANINQFEQQYGQYRTIVTTYPSTSMIESPNKSERYFYVFDESSILMHKTFEQELHSLPNHFNSFDDFDEASFDPVTALKFVDKYAPTTDEKDAADKLKKLINEIL